MIQYNPTKMKIKRWTSVVTFVQNDDALCLRHGSLLSYQGSFLMCGLVSCACNTLEDNNSLSVLVQCFFYLEISEKTCGY